MTEYWHFLANDRRLQYDDRTPVVVGETLKITEKPILCQRGFHFSERAIDALHYAPGAVICRVTVGGRVVMGDDKGCAQERTVIWMADATRVLHEFACWAATKAMDEEEAREGKVDPRSRKAVEVKLLWLDGKATDEELFASDFAAARSAAYAVAAYASYASAVAARSAASYSASYSASAASYSASASYASYAAAAAEMNIELEWRLFELKPE